MTKAKLFQPVVDELINHDATHVPITKQNMEYLRDTFLKAAKQAVELYKDHECQELIETYESSSLSNIIKDHKDYTNDEWDDYYGFRGLISDITGEEFE